MPQTFHHIAETVDHLFRQQSGRMVAVLTRLMGLQHLEAAQDIVQDSLMQAMKTWPYSGMPQNPEAWLYRVARNRAVDFLRRKRKWTDISPQYAHLLQSEYSLAATVDQHFLDHGIADSTLRMIFACCHPAVPVESQLALALHTLCGLSKGEIAKAFLIPEETVAKRIYRAREKMRQENISLDMPPAPQLALRLDAVLHCLYLLFNEGYNAAQSDQLIREELCREAMRLSYLLTELKATSLPRVYALLALFCFQASRLDSRLDHGGHIILLQQQDRSRWYQPLIRQGFAFLDLAAEPYEVSVYHLEAGIASLHAAAPSLEATDWQSICKLYTVLYDVHPFPVIGMNKAIATAYAFGPGEALEQLKRIVSLDHYYLYHVALGDMYLMLQQPVPAKASYEKALSLTCSKPEQELICRKLQQCSH